MKLRFLLCLALSLAASAQDKKAVTDQSYRVFRSDDIGVRAVQFVQRSVQRGRFAAAGWAG